MKYRRLPALARQSPSLTFGLVGGTFALCFVLTASVRRLLERGPGPLPSGPEILLVVGGFLGGALLARVLWTRLGGGSSPIRGALVGGLIGLLAMPVPMFVLELAVVAMGEFPFDVQPNAPLWSQAASAVLLLFFIPLLLGALGLIATYGGTVIIGGATGYLLARR